MAMKIAVLIVIGLVFFALIFLASCKTKKEEILFPEESLLPEENLFPVEVKGRLGYINKTGKIVINPQFENAESESSLSG